MFVEAFVAKLATEAFDVTVLHGATRLDQQMLDAVLLRPGNEGTAGELRAVVGSYCTRVPAEARRLIQHTHHVGTADAVINGNVDAFVTEIIGDGQALESAAIGQWTDQPFVDIRAP